MYPNCRQLVAAAYFMGVLKSDYFKTSKQFAELRKTFQEKQRDFTLSTIDSYKGKIADSIKALWTSRENAQQEITFQKFFGFLIRFSCSDFLSSLHQSPPPPIRTRIGKYSKYIFTIYPILTPPIEVQIGIQQPISIF